MKTFGNDDSLPSYKNPPLVETVMSIQFQTLQNMTNAHLGAFWVDLNKNGQWPTVRHQPLIGSQIETFNKEPWPPYHQGFHFTQNPACRVQMLNKNENRMVQIQNDRLAFNWRKTEDNDSYPTHKKNKESFGDVWKKLTEFIASQSLGNLKPIQWEVVYVNNISKDGLWDNLSQWPKLLPGLLGQDNTLTDNLNLESINGNWTFEIPSKRGRLYIELAPGKSVDNKQEDILALKLTARGPIEQDEYDKIINGIELGHKVIVKSFDTIISKNAHKVWSRHDSNITTAT